MAVAAAAAFANSNNKQWGRRLPTLPFQTRSTRFFPPHTHAAIYEKNRTPHTSTQKKRKKLTWKLVVDAAGEPPNALPNNPLGEFKLNRSEMDIQVSPAMIWLLSSNSRCCCGCCSSSDFCFDDGNSAQTVITQCLLIIWWMMV